MKMTPRAVLRLGALLGLSALTSGVAADEIHLAITGEPGTRFIGECRVTTAEGNRLLVLDGEVPVEHRWRGRGVDCRLQQTSRHGQLTVDLAKTGSLGHSRTQSQGGRIYLQLR